MFSSPLSTLSFCTEASKGGSCFNTPLIGSSTGEGGGIIRITLNFFSTMYLPLSFANCQKKKLVS